MTTVASSLGGGPLLRGLADNWWMLLLRGLAAVLFGVLALSWPLLTLVTLTFLWAAYALIDGAIALWEAFAGRDVRLTSRIWLALVGLCGLAAGVATFAWPGMTALVLLTFIAVWSIVTGVFEIWGAIQLRKEIRGEWLLILSGVLSIAFGVILLVWPGAGALAVVWLIGWYAVLIGGLHIGLAFRLRRHKRPA